MLDDKQWDLRQWSTSLARKTSMWWSATRATRQRRSGMRRLAESKISWEWWLISGPNIDTIMIQVRAMSLQLPPHLQRQLPEDRLSQVCVDWLPVFLLYFVYKSKPDNLEIQDENIFFDISLSPDQTVRGSSTWRLPHPHLSLCRRSGLTSPCHVSFLSKWHFDLRCLGCAGSLVLIATTLSSSTPSTMPSPGMISFTLLYSLLVCCSHRILPQVSSLQKSFQCGTGICQDQVCFLIFSLKNLYLTNFSFSGQ